MNDILNRLTVLLALVAFGIIAAVGFMTGAPPPVALFRATTAFVFFGFFGRMGIRIVLKGILEELAIHREEEEKKNQAVQEASAASNEKIKQRAEESTPATK